MKRPVRRDDFMLRDADDELICDTSDSLSSSLESDDHLDEIAACVNLVPELIPVMEEALSLLKEWCAACPRLTDERDERVAEQLIEAIAKAKACIK